MTTGTGDRGATDRGDRTRTSAFGSGKREGHDASGFYARFSPPTLSDDDTVNRPADLLESLGRGRAFCGDARAMSDLPDDSVALVVTSPPYFVGKEYELAVADGDDGIPGSYLEFLDMLRSVFAECRRVLEPGGRIAVNVANLGRKPYRSLSADVVAILQDDLGLLLRGEVIWEKSATSSGSCAWGSFAKASNPVLRDMTERVVIASKGRFSRARTAAQRRKAGLPHVSTLTNDEFLEVTRDVWRIDAESATRIGHPAPFPVDLPRRLIDLYTYEDDIVLDPFLGSGTTLVAAARAGRIGVGYDTDPSYVELSERRLGAELERAAELDTAADAYREAAPDERAEVVGGLDPAEREEVFRTLAVEEGRKVQDIAEQRLVDAGFPAIRSKVRHPSGIVEFDFLVTGPGDRAWWVDVTGGFTSSRPGLQRTDAVWRLLGRLHVLTASTDHLSRETPQTLVLTSHLPTPGSPADKALRSVGPDVVFDAIELHDPAGLERLRRYAQSADPAPLPGFWSHEDVARRLPLR